MVVVKAKDFSNVNFVNIVLCLGVPRLLRSDRGTETVTVAGLQSYLRHKDADEMSGSRSFMYGKSTANQVNKFNVLRRENLNFFRELRLGGDISEEVERPSGLTISKFVHFTESTL